MSAASVNGSGSAGTASRRDPGSFRDPSGVVFERDGVVFRQINPVYLPHYRRLMESGLYTTLTGAGLLVPHEEAGTCETPAGTGLIIRPAPRKFRSSRIPTSGASSSTGTRRSPRCGRRPPRWTTA